MLQSQCGLKPTWPTRGLGAGLTPIPCTRARPHGNDMRWSQPGGKGEVHWRLEQQAQLRASLRSEGLCLKFRVDRKPIVADAT